MSKNVVQLDRNLGRNTLMPSGGVFRCCLSSVAHQVDMDYYYQGGEKLSCEHCHRVFTLEETKDGLSWVSPIGDD